MTGALIEAWLAAYNDRDWEAFREQLAPDCVYEEIVKPPRRFEGADAIIEVFKAWAEAMPGPRARLVSLVHSGDERLAIEFALEGTQSPFGDFGPSGRPPQTFGAIFATIGNGRITSLRAYIDSLALYQVLGIRPGGAPPRQAPS